MTNNNPLKFAVMAMLIIFASCAQQAEPQEQASPPAIDGEEEVQAAENVQGDTQAIKGLPDDIKELLDRKSRIKSISYKYKGPETQDNFYDFYIKDGKIKYLPWRSIKSLDSKDSFDTIYLDNGARTAASYCVTQTCLYRGKKAELDYDGAYIRTIFDWTNGIERATKLADEIIDDRNTQLLETDNGLLWIDSFYGVALKAEHNGEFYRFQHISVNDVADSDVTPP